MNLQDVSAQQNASKHAGRKGEGPLIVALASGATVQEASTRAGVSVSTARRRLDDPSFRQQVSAARGELIAQGVGHLANATVAAVQTLRELLDSEAATVRLGAARAVLENVVRLRESAELEARIAALEATLPQGQQRRGA